MHAGPDSDTYPNAYGDAYTDARCNAHADTYSDSNADTDPNLCTYAYPRAGRNAVRLSAGGGDGRGVHVRRGRGGHV